MLDYSKIPPHMHKGVKLYVEKKVPPGSFLRAVLENDFYEAVVKADQINLCYFREWAKFLYRELPSICWGSKEKVQAWLDGEKI